MLRYLVLVLLACFVSTKRIDSFHKKHLQKTHLRVGDGEWQHDLPFSKSKVNHQDDTIGYRDIGAGNHIMMTCGGCARTLPNTESWTDLLVQSHVETKTKNVRYLYALKGPAQCSEYPEFDFEPVADAIFAILTQDNTAQLVSIPHSSGGASCGSVLRALHERDSDGTVLLGRVTHLSLDAGASLVLSLRSKGIFHEHGLWGFYAVDSVTGATSFNFRIAHRIKSEGGEEEEIKNDNGCDNPHCEHFAFFCHKPPHVEWETLVLGGDCPKDLNDLESSYLDKIPFE